MNIFLLIPLIICSIAFAWFFLTIGLTLGAMAMGHVPESPLRPLGDGQWITVPIMAATVPVSIIASTMSDQVQYVIGYAIMGNITFIMAGGLVLNFCSDEQQARIRSWFSRHQLTED